jgi:hypothetical protein
LYIVGSSMDVPLRERDVRRENACGFQVIDA